VIVHGLSLCCGTHYPCSRSANTVDVNTGRVTNVNREHGRLSILPMFTASSWRKRNRGRPAWKDTVWRDTVPLDSAGEYVTLKALNREEWKEWTV